MDSRTLIKQLEADGWYLVGVKGSHHQYKHPSKVGRVTVPHPKKRLTYWYNQKYLEASWPRMRLVFD